MTESGSGFRTLTMQEIENLPPCVYDVFAKCDKKGVTLEYCEACLFEGIEKALYNEKFGLAMHFVDILTVQVRKIKPPGLRH